MSVRYIDGPRLRRSLMAACEYAQGQRAELNRINVFPVPDGDTGTNLALTVRTISDHLRDNTDREISAVAHTAAQGAILGARGNCGMLLSHFLLGFAEHLRERSRIGTEEFGQALRAGSEHLYASIEEPVEGTILTVIRDTAGAATASTTRSFVPLVTELVQEARQSLARTPDLLPVLKSAGVVDAGAQGFVSLLEGVMLYVRGEPVIAVSTGEEEEARAAAPVSRVEYPAGEERYQFCTEALVRGDALPTQQAVRDVLRENADSLIVIRSDDVLKVHVHTDDPEGVFSYLRGVGTLVTHKAEDMLVQHETIGRAAGGHIRLARRPVAIMTDSASDLPEEIVRAHGIHITPLTLIDGDRTYRDRLDITAEEFHRRLGEGGALPTTSQPAPADFMETFEQAAQEGEAIVGVLVASTLSGTFASGQAAAWRFEAAPVHLADSLGGSLLQGLLVLKAAELAELGQSPETIVEELGRVRAQSGLLFTVKTFARLIASGRVGRGPALVGRLLGIKPILGLTHEGRVTRFGQALGSGRARRALLDLLRAQIPADARRVRFGIVFVGNPEVAEPVAREIRATYGEDVEILRAPVTPVIATHLGVGAWGVAYMVED